MGTITKNKERGKKPSWNLMGNLIRIREAATPSKEGPPDPTALSCGERMVLVSLAVREGDHGIFPSEPTIAADAGLSVRQVRRILNTLETRGIISRTRRSRKRGAYRGLNGSPDNGTPWGTSTIYKLHLDGLRDGGIDGDEQAAADNEAIAGDNEQHVVRCEYELARGSGDCFLCQPRETVATADTTSSPKTPEDTMSSPTGHHVPRGRTPCPLPPDTTSPGGGHHVLQIFQ